MRSVGTKKVGLLLGLCLLALAAPALAQEAPGPEQPVEQPEEAFDWAENWGLPGQVGMGLCLGLAGLGSALGVGAAGRAAAGAWAREARAGRPLSFIYIVLLGMPLSQTIYGFVLMRVGLYPRVYAPELVATSGWALMGIGIGCGLAQWGSAWMQGNIGGAAVRALSEAEGAGFVFMIIAMGIAETVGLFGFVFMFLVLPG